MGVQLIAIWKHTVRCHQIVQSGPLKDGTQGQTVRFIAVSVGKFDQRQKEGDGA